MSDTQQDVPTAPHTGRKTSSSQQRQCLWCGADGGLPCTMYYGWLFSPGETPEEIGPACSIDCYTNLARRADDPQNPVDNPWRRVTDTETRPKHNAYYWCLLRGTDEPVHAEHYTKRVHLMQYNNKLLLWRAFDGKCFDVFKVQYYRAVGDAPPPPAEEGTT